MWSTLYLVVICVKPRNAQNGEKSGFYRRHQSPLTSVKRCVLQSLAPPSASSSRAQTKPTDRARHGQCKCFLFSNAVSLSRATSRSPQWVRFQYENKKRQAGRQNEMLNYHAADVRIYFTWLRQLLTNYSQVEQSHLRSRRPKNVFLSWRAVTQRYPLWEFPATLDVFVCPDGLRHWVCNRFRFSSCCDEKFLAVSKKGGKINESYDRLGLDYAKFMMIQFDFAISIIK